MSSVPPGWCYLYTPAGLSESGVHSCGKYYRHYNCHYQEMVKLSSTVFLCFDLISLSSASRTQSSVLSHIFLQRMNGNFSIVLWTIIRLYYIRATAAALWFLLTLNIVVKLQFGDQALIKNWREMFWIRVASSNDEGNILCIRFMRPSPLLQNFLKAFLWKNILRAWLFTVINEAVVEPLVRGS